MSKKDTLPDAWDDEWESVADKPEAPEKSEEPKKPVKLSQAERRRQHQELNRQIWQSAEQPPEPMVFLQARDTVPLQSSFKPGVTLLSRKPTPQVLSRDSAAAGMAGLSIEDGDDSEEERRKNAEASFAERKAKAQLERAEKERRYAEARERLFGSETPSTGNLRGASPNKQTRGKGRGRGGRESQPRSSNDQSPARPANSARQLYEPAYSPKPTSIYIQKKESGESRPQTPNDQHQPVREPRGPQPIGRDGRGFVPRGNFAGVSK